MTEKELRDKISKGINDYSQYIQEETSESFVTANVNIYKKKITEIKELEKELNQTKVEVKVNIPFDILEFFSNNLDKIIKERIY